MKVLVILAVLGFAWAAPSIKQKSGEIVNVNVFYESLCPDSKAFIHNQLLPTVNQLGAYMNVTMNPFGKASFTPVGETWEFTCQHGPAECDGNILQSCVFRFTEDPNIELRYIDCLMMNPGQGQACGTMAGQSYEPSIKECYEGLEGRALLKEYGVETLALQPTLTFVPWIVFDGVWSSDSQWNSLSNFKLEVCSRLDPLPAECQ